MGGGEEAFGCRMVGINHTKTGVGSASGPFISVLKVQCVGSVYSSVLEKLQLVCANALNPSTLSCSTVLKLGCLSQISLFFCNDAA